MTYILTDVMVKKKKYFPATTFFISKNKKVTIAFENLYIGVSFFFFFNEELKISTPAVSNSENKKRNIRRE